MGYTRREQAILYGIPVVFGILLTIATLYVASLVLDDLQLSRDNRVMIEQILKQHPIPGYEEPKP